MNASGRVSSVCLFRLPLLSVKPADKDILKLSYSLVEYNHLPLSLQKKHKEIDSLCSPILVKL